MGGKVERRSNALDGVNLWELPLGRHADGASLYLQVTGPTSRSWLFRYNVNNKQRWAGLGSLRDVPLSDARKLRKQTLQRVRRDGVDPVGNRRQARESQRAVADREASSKTFKEAADDYIRRKEKVWENKKHAIQWATTLEKYAYPVFGDMLVEKIERQHVIEALEPIWKMRRETANRVRGRIEAVIEYAIAKEWCSDQRNPAELSDRLKQALPERTRKVIKHFKALPYKEAPSFMTRLRAENGIAARALAFGILTAARPGEARGARWSEINMADRSWTIPADRMKKRKAHTVPLSTAAMSLLNDLTPSADGLVFPNAGGGMLSENTLGAVLKRMGLNVTAHGFRSTFLDWAADTTSFERQVREFALAHGIPDTKTEAAYRHESALEKRRELMQAWSDYCGSERADPPAAGDNVVPIKRATG